MNTMTITIDLPPALAEPLLKLAASRGCTPEEAARAVISEHLATTAKSGSPALDPVIAAAMADTFRENDELYRRLAR